MREYNLEQLVGGKWLPVLFKAKWFVDVRRYRTFDITVGTETFTAKGEFLRWNFEIKSNKDNKVVAKVGLEGQQLLRWTAPNSQVYAAVVDETRINPALVASLLSILERSAIARNAKIGLTVGAAAASSLALKH